MKKIIPYLLITTLVMGILITSTVKAVVYWTIVDPGKIQAYLSQVVHQIQSFAYKQMMHKLQTELSVNIQQTEHEEDATQTARAVAATTQTATDIHNQTMKLKTSKDPHACSLVEQADSLAYSQATLKKSLESNGKLPKQHTNAVNAPDTEKLVTESDAILLTINKYMAGEPISPSDAILLASSLRPTLVQSTSRGVGKQNRALHEYKRSAFNNVVQSNMQHLLLSQSETKDTLSYSEQLTSSLSSDFGGNDSLRLEFVLNSNPQLKQQTPSTKKDLYANLAILKAKELKVSFEEYKSNLRKEVATAMKVRQLQVLLKNL